MTKICRKCNDEFDTSFFQALGFKCKFCAQADSRKWRENNRIKHREYSRHWYKQHKEYALNAQKEYAKNNPHISKKCRDNNRKTPKGKINHSISTLMSRSLLGGKGGKHWEELVNYTVCDLKKHLEKQFINGMDWNNYGKFWHIDHKIPRAVFNFSSTDDIDFKRCWALNNLQPLRAIDNLSKNAKLEIPFQPSLLLQWKEAI